MPASPWFSAAMSTCQAPPLSPCRAPCTGHGIVSLYLSHCHAIPGASPSPDLSNHHSRNDQVMCFACNNSMNKCRDDDEWGRCLIKPQNKRIHFGDHTHQSDTGWKAAVSFWGSPRSPGAACLLNSQIAWKLKVWISVTRPWGQLHGQDCSRLAQLSNVHKTCPNGVRWMKTIAGKDEVDWYL